jgi:GT2 family glycosyltransferase
MDNNSDVGVLGARLQNPDGSLQESCYKFEKPFVKILRRTPLRSFSVIKKMIDEHLMRNVEHDKIMDVDWLMGASLCVRREVWEELNGFDENFLLYFEDTDFCRRAWQAGRRVVYHPGITMTHYHRREGSDGNFISQLFRRANILHMASWLKYTKKYFRAPNPRIIQV